MAGLFDLDLLDDVDPFEIDRQVAHLFKPPAPASRTSMPNGNPTRSSTRPHHRRTR
ncbi:MAG: hypothetical protein K1X38_06170 [Microthrixaceae bacterium]|nr:hypothetical protein [Microthrixaceae bacterium]